MSDLLNHQASADYNADAIEVLEDVEHVRLRPAMYIGSTDDRALHHLVSEILDNSIDEAVAGHATKIMVSMFDDGSISIGDNGRGIPTAAHKKFKDKPTVEIAATKLMSGGKFKQGAYQTAGGLHGVGLSVVNALSAWMHIEVAREKKLVDIKFTQGVTSQPLQDLGGAP
ncbi:MAG: ATP-binding protein, partial [Alphaproteobacteria bacterium]